MTHNPRALLICMPTMRTCAAWQPSLSPLRPIYLSVYLLQSVLVRLLVYDPICRLILHNMNLGIDWITKQLLRSTLRGRGAATSRVRIAQNT
ncbi:hypothetical protein GGR52DRAFT_548358 [Hypoxylon sp. FL1284]|nr:hypothetical protein GGR52DRAFT_548358 [Hypoxylon sp. FL1284]